MSASRPLGMLTTVRSSVRIRVERRPIASTSPSTPSMITQSPTRNGWSIPMETDPKKCSSVFCAPSATAMPPIPSPARIVAIGYPKLAMTVSSPATSTRSRAIRPPSGINERNAGCEVPQSVEGSANCSTPITRRRIQKTATTAVARWRSRMNVSAPTGNAIQYSSSADVATPISSTMGPCTEATSTSSSSVSVRLTRRLSRAWTGPASSAPTSAASGRSVRSASHCHHWRSSGPVRRSAAGRCSRIQASGSAPNSASTWPTVAAEKTQRAPPSCVRRVSAIGTGRPSGPATSPITSRSRASPSAVSPIATGETWSASSRSRTSSTTASRRANSGPRARRASSARSRRAAARARSFVRTAARKSCTATRGETESTATAAAATCRGGLEGPKSPCAADGRATRARRSGRTRARSIPQPQRSPGASQAGPRGWL